MNQINVEARVIAVVVAAQRLRDMQLIESGAIAPGVFSVPVPETFTAREAAEELAEAKLRLTAEICNE